MARTSEMVAGNEPKNDVYFGMLAVTAACMAFGILLMFIEWAEYDFETDAKPAPAVALPPPVPPLADAQPPAAN